MHSTMCEAFRKSVVPSLQRQTQPWSQQDQYFFVPRSKTSLYLTKQSPVGKNQSSLPSVKLLPETCTEVQSRKKTTIRQGKETRDIQKRISQRGKCVAIQLGTKNSDFDFCKQASGVSLEGISRWNAATCEKTEWKRFLHLRFDCLLLSRWHFFQLFLSSSYYVKWTEKTSSFCWEQLLTKMFPDKQWMTAEALRSGRSTNYLWNILKLMSTMLWC